MMTTPRRVVSTDALYFSDGSLTREAPARAGPSREDGQDSFGFPSRVPDYRIVRMARALVRPSAHRYDPAHLMRDVPNRWAWNTSSRFSLSGPTAATELLHPVHYLSKLGNGLTDSGTD
jgi:hypothetical protein